jgi:hypothetical protein
LKVKEKLTTDEELRKNIQKKVEVAPFIDDEAFQRSF